MIFPRVCIAIFFEVKKWRLVKLNLIYKINIFVVLELSAN